MRALRGNPYGREKLRLSQWGEHIVLTLHPESPAEASVLLSAAEALEFAYHLQGAVAERKPASAALGSRWELLELDDATCSQEPAP